VKVAIPHFLGGKELINATFFGEPFAIRNTSFENDEMVKRWKDQAPYYPTIQYFTGS
jgi:hypothetical protein